MEQARKDIALKVTSYLTLTILLIAISFLFLLWLLFEHRPPWSYFGITSSFLAVIFLSCCAALVVLKFSLKYLIIISSIGAVIAIHFLTTELARGTVHFIAWYITDSSAAKGINSLINWDGALKKVTYSVYAIAFFIEIAYLHTVLMKRNTTKAINRIIAGIFVLSFPTITSWQIEYTCGGFGGNCQRSLEVVTPLVMSVNPIYMCISIVSATFIVILYSKFNRVVLI